MKKAEELRAPAAGDGEAVPKDASLDDARISRMVHELLHGLVEEQEPQEVNVVQLDNWFGVRWRGFGWKIMGAAGIQFRYGFRIPPLHPNRVRREWQFEREDGGAYVPKLDAGPIHIHQKSERNSKRLMSKGPLPQVWVWYSGNTVQNDRSSLLVYLIRGPEDDEAWYLEHVRTNDAWKLSTCIGVDRQRFRSMVERCGGSGWAPLGASVPE